MPSLRIMLVVLLVAAVFASTQAQLNIDVASLPVNATVNDTPFIINQPANYLQVYALPVGQGDCTIIQCPKPSGKIIVFDCGSSGFGHGYGLNAQQVAEFLGDQFNKVTAIFITHPDEDHYSYLDQIWNKYNTNIRFVAIGGTVNNYPNTMANWLLSFKARLHVINNGAPCIGGDCPYAYFCGTDYNIKFDILAANVGQSSNAKSIVMKVVDERSRWSILLPGDIEGKADAMNNIANTLQEQLQSYVYKMTHHGSKSTKANQNAWLQYIRPNQAFASSGYNYGRCCHPRYETIENLQQYVDGNAAGHDFYCGVGPKQPCLYQQYTRHIFETTPRHNKICLLQYHSSFQSYHYCRDVIVVDDGLPSDDDDECEEENPKEELHYEKKAPQEEHCQASPNSVCQDYECPNL